MLGHWHPPPAILASMLLHGAAITSLAVAPQHWSWLLQGLVANHAALGLLGMHPRSRMLGRNLWRLPPASRIRGEVALTFDDGPDPEVTPRVLDLLDEAGAHASFFVIGREARRCPALIREIRLRGHSVENHTFSHPLFLAARGPMAHRREILMAQEAIREAGGDPRYFRAPLGLRSPLLYPALDTTGLLHVSWTHRGADGLVRSADRVLKRFADTRAGDILLLHDGRQRHGQTAVLEMLGPLLRQLTAKGLRSVSLPEVLSAAQDGT
ncbi:MAG: polysaccharide deacetylase family protein [Azospirillum brasilense]|nr:MAG: polysaccharide deacetylase family protein [Azospirillum brasilense]